MDPDAIFKVRFLADVFNEKPVGSKGMNKVVTRFPLEPNGFLHLGHTRSIMINFGFARFHSGECYLRFDDTNPSGEEEKFFVAIEDIIEWLGFTPVRVTNSSDNFLRLYELAENLIERSGAYVCHCTTYRVLDGSRLHHKTGHAWKIYPTYDFTHCLCDSFEGITHSLCTTEFELSRASYEWLCDKFGVYKPMQREFGRLNLSGTVLSKRKIITLIENGHVHDWDDPRLYTLSALRRRGVPPGVLLAFVNELRVTKAPSTIDVKRFEQVVRRYLETTVPRLMLVLDPITIIIENLPEDFIEMIELPFSKDPVYGVHRVPFTRTIYIDRDDFRETASKDFFRLALGSSVGLLKVPYPITATGFEKDPTTGLVTLVRAKYEQPVEGSALKKSKTYIHWIAECPTQKSPIKARVRVFGSLFNSNSPETHLDGFLSVVNPNSEEIFSNAMVEMGFEEIRRRAPWPSLEGERKREKAGEEARPETVRFQGMRIAYFCVDRDEEEGKLVLNRIVSLKEDPKKG